MPNHAGAFWPFPAAANASGGGITPSPSTPTLQAATNIDPNPDKGLAGAIQTSDNAVLAYAGPSGTIADVSAAQPDRISVYVVRPGDTISEIADMFGVSVNTIVWANNLSGPKDVHVGDTLVILPVSGISHVVTKGETLQSVAKKFGGDPKEIAQYNGLDPAEPLAAGTTVLIPGGDISPQKSPAAAEARRGAVRNSAEPYLGGSGPARAGYYENPVPGAILTQGIHGWNAVDLAAPRGTPVHAAADGTVIIARDNNGWNGGYGNYVVITHGNGTQTLYAHMTHTAVSAGQAVSAGDVIGYLGSTGESTGPHLHFEVRGAANPFRTCRLNSVCSPQ